MYHSRDLKKQNGDRQELQNCQVNKQRAAH